MTLHIVDNKKLDMTQDEWDMYSNIVKSYTTNTNNGEDMFMDLFESDQNGIIIFLKPPSKRQSSFEVYLFLMSLFEHQHMRILYTQVSDIAKEMKDKLAEINQKLKDLEEKSS